MEATGTWATVLYLVAAMDITAAILALVVLRPMLKRHHANNASAADRGADGLGMAAEWSLRRT